MKKPGNGVLAPVHNQRGISLILVLVAVVVVGLMATMAGRTWTSVMQQAREDELLFRGDQYRRAIESYYNAKFGGKGSYPPSVEALLKDPRSPEVRRHLRQRYKDPFTGEDFVLIGSGGQVSGSVSTTQASGGIRGVKSSSTLKPFKQDGFPKEYETFKGADSYSKWEFIFEPTAEAQPQTGTPTPTTTPPLGSSPFK